MKWLADKRKVVLTDWQQNRISYAEALQRLNALAVPLATALIWLEA